MKSGNNSKRSPSDTDVIKLDIQGHDFVIMRLLMGKRQEQRILSLEDIARVEKDDIIKDEALTPPAFPKPEVSQMGELVPDATEETRVAWQATKDARAQWEADKAEFEKLHPVPTDQRLITLWMPVFHVTKVTMDGMSLRIFHTARAVFMGAVRNEDSNRVMLYSPCIIDPNIERGRVHFLPIAFAGLDFILYKPTCIGESIPQVAEIVGYPAFVEANRKGDYQFRMRAAYHHVEADVPVDAEVHSVNRDVRSLNAGLIPTSDTTEGPAIAKARQFNAMVKPAPRS
jgi:hypothetical protein